MTEVNTFVDPEVFLEKIQVELESNEAANSLMLGVCGRLVRYPERVQVAPCLKTVEDENGLVLAAMMTPPYKLVVVHHQGELDEGASVLVRDLIREGWKVPGVVGPSEVAWEIAGRLGELTGRGYSLERRQRVYELREVKTRVPERGRLRLAMETDIALVTRWWYEFSMEIWGEADQEEARGAVSFRIGEGDIYLWDNGQPVSMAMKNRPTRRGISVSAVYTPLQLRHGGYASACVGELSRMLLAAGQEFCALFADVTNAAAISIYQRVGYRPVCDYDEYVFSEEG